LYKFARMLLVTAFCTALPVAEAVQLKYSFQPGKTYDYQITESENSSFSAYKMNSSGSSNSGGIDFSIRSIAFQDNAFIVDINSGQGSVRRYIKENGEIKGAPSETGLGIPFLIIFPAEDWKINERKQLRKELSIGNQKVSATWNLLLKSHDAENNIAEVLFVLALKLPEDRLRKKDISIKGRVLFNLASGIIQQAEWNSSYQFEMVNREMAVSRPLWKFSRQTSHSLVLKNIREQ